MALKLKILLRILHHTLIISCIGFKLYPTILLEDACRSKDLLQNAHVPVCTAFKINFQQANNAATHFCVYSGDPRRPYPQDIEMRSGLLGRLMEGVPSESDQPVTGASTLQELTQPSVLHVSQPVGGLGRFYRVAAAQELAREK